MEKVNLIVVLARDGRFLLCRRRKEPYTGKLNFVGGHIEPKESGEDAAYRELEEETGISREDISLSHVIDFTYHAFDVLLEVWAGRLGREVEVYGEENELLWYCRTQTASATSESLPGTATCSISSISAHFCRTA